MGPLDRCLEARFQVCGATDVIDMAVGQPDFVDRDASLSDGAIDLRQVATRIDDHGALCGFAPQQCAILLEGGDRDDDGIGFGHGRCAPDRNGFVWTDVGRPIGDFSA